MTSEVRGSAGETPGRQLKEIQKRHEDSSAVGIRVEPIVDLVTRIESGNLDLREFKDEEHYRELLDVVGTGLATVVDAALKLEALRAVAVESRERNSGDSFQDLCAVIEDRLKPLGIGEYAINLLQNAMREAVVTLRFSEQMETARDTFRKQTTESDPRVGEYNEAVRELARLVKLANGKLDVRLPGELESLKHLLLSWSPEAGLSTLWPDIEFVDRNLPENQKKDIFRLLIQDDERQNGLHVEFQKNTKRQWVTERKEFLPYQIRGKEVIGQDAVEINRAREAFLPSLREGGTVEITTIEQFDHLEPALRTLGTDNELVRFKDRNKRILGGLESGEVKMELKLSSSGNELELVIYEDGEFSDLLTFPTEEKMLTS